MDSEKEEELFSDIAALIEVEPSLPTSTPSTMLTRGADIYIHTRNPKYDSFDRDTTLHGFEGDPKNRYFLITPKGTFRIYPDKKKKQAPSFPQESSPTQWEKTKTFVHNHKKEILIGAAIVVGSAAAITLLVLTSATAAATTAASAAALAATPNPASRHKDKSPSVSSSVTPSCTSALLAQDAELLKDFVSAHDLFSSPSFDSGSFSSDFAWEETGRTLTETFIHQSYHHLSQELELPSSPLKQEIAELHKQYIASQGRKEHALPSNMVSLLSSNEQTDLPTLFWQKDGERALSSQQYHRAVADFTQAISISPSDPLNYLKRGISHFELGEYDQSIQDFAQFSSHSPAIETPFLYEFTKGFVKGFPRGVKDSTKGMVSFLNDIATHPIQTAKQLAEGITTLVHLYRNEEYKVLFEGLFPEVHTLITQWDTLSPIEKGDLASYAFGKYGADLFGPTLVAKVTQKSVKCAQELASLSKKLKTTQEILLLETSAEIGNSAKLAEIIETTKNTIGMAEELGLTTQEIGQLKQTEKLRGSINNGEKLISQSESAVYKDAISQNKHIKMVRDCLDKPAKEIQKSVNSYEKQIALHKDKIANPVKYYPDWDKLDPRQREALINKKWPAEIQVYEEQRDVLLSILNERLSHE